MPFYQGLLPRSKPRAGRRRQLDAESTRRWRSQKRRESTGPTLSCTASAARFCSKRIRRIRRRRRKPSSPPSPSRNSRRQRASSCARRCRWRSFINRPTAPPTPMPCSRPRSKVFRRRRNFRRSKRRKRCSPRSPKPTGSEAPPRRASDGSNCRPAYGQAIMWSKGFGSEETKAAFVQARELAGGLDNPAERSSAYYGAWLASFTRAEIAQAQETAEAFLKDATQRPGSPEAGLGHRGYGINLLVPRDCWRSGTR